MPLPHDYPELLASIDRWQSDARDRHPGVIPCRAGCSACCHGPFDISVADALLVRDGVLALPPDLRSEVRRRAAAQMDRMLAWEPGLSAPWDVSALGDARFDALVEAFREDPCPALDDQGSCRIYESRPMICRLMGLGLATPAGDVIENACPIQDEFPDYRALPPQPFDLDAWDAAEAPARQRAATTLFGSAERTDYETTVAGAVLLAEPKAGAASAGRG